MGSYDELAFQVKLHFTDGALRLIAKKAMAKNTGARGLRAILENILIDAMYEVCLLYLLLSDVHCMVIFEQYYLGLENQPILSWISRVISESAKSELIFMRVAR
jgi:ATP-dependent protease Clp ATPase subunit